METSKWITNSRYVIVDGPIEALKASRTPTFLLNSTLWMGKSTFWVSV